MVKRNCNKRLRNRLILPLCSGNQKNFSTALNFLSGLRYKVLLVARKEVWGAIW